MRLGAIWAWVAFSLLGVLMTCLGAGVLHDARLSTRWPTAEGTIVLSQIEPYTDSDGHTHDRANVVYEYVVDGTVYSGTKIAFGKYNVPPERLLSKHPPGAAVSVYYDPDDPAVAVLEPGTSWESYGPLVAGVIFLGVGLGTILWRAVSAG